MIKRSKCCIIGIPDHQAIIHVGGRLGAAGGPTSFRQFFSRLRGRSPFEKILQDLGDVGEMTEDVNVNHRLATDFIAAGHLSNGISVVIGGGHDHGYSHLAGVLEALKRKNKQVRLGCINIDAHLDVRKPDPLITSGSPFYLAIESKILDPKRFIEFGIQSHCNASPLWDYVQKKDISIIPFNRLREGKTSQVFKKSLKKLSTTCDAIVISLDLDSAASAYSPGVSAPQSEGFTSMEIISMMEIAAKEAKTVSLGIFELNPEHDSESRSARLAATAAYHFIESKFFA